MSELEIQSIRAEEDTRNVSAESVGADFASYTCCERIPKRRRCLQSEREDIPKAQHVREALPCVSGCTRRVGPIPRRILVNLEKIPWAGNFRHGTFGALCLTMARDHPSMKLERNILHVEKLVIALMDETGDLFPTLRRIVESSVQGIREEAAYRSIMCSCALIASNILVPRIKNVQDLPKVLTGVSMDTLSFGKDHWRSTSCFSYWNRGPAQSMASYRNL
ncbi:hypothetical protein BDZ45DRAFT_750032 [Acephala macrosclerotiorum]|nr:hypothetical protein BDZ45DRAFT_750032 [Acephala macrosclerotiorum]